MLEDDIAGFANPVLDLGALDLGALDLGAKTRLLRMRLCCRPLHFLPLSNGFCPVRSETRIGTPGSSNASRMLFTR
jgi:hypothetical protein